MPVPSEGRFPADRFKRALRKHEKLHAGRILPGSTTWSEALDGVGRRMAGIGSPVKRAGVLNKTIGYLKTVPEETLAHIGIVQYGGSRAAGLVLATMGWDRHPFIGVDEEGVLIYLHPLRCTRGGEMSAQTGLDLAYVSWHALARLFERGYDVTNLGVTGVIAFVGVLGLLTRNSEKHLRGELNLHFGAVLVTGSMKHAAKSLPDGSRINGSLYDVRTVLETDEIRDPNRLEQGRIAAETVAAWLASDRNPEHDERLAEAIPFLPRRDSDNTLRAARHEPC